MTRRLANLTTDLIPDPKNANKGTVRGRALIEDSLRALGAGRSIVTDRNGVILAGNKTAEVAVGELGMGTIVVESDGTKLVVVRRTDLDLDQDANARALAYADNRAGELSLEWDGEALAETVADGQVDLTEYGFSQAELDAIIQGFPGDSPVYDESVAADLTVSARWTLSFRQDDVGLVREALLALQRDVPTLAWKEDTTV